MITVPWKEFDSNEDLIQGETPHLAVGEGRGCWAPQGMGTSPRLPEAQGGIAGVSRAGIRVGSMSCGSLSAWDIAGFCEFCWSWKGFVCEPGPRATWEVLYELQGNSDLAVEESWAPSLATEELHPDPVNKRLWLPSWTQSSPWESGVPPLLCPAPLCPGGEVPSASPGFCAVSHGLLSAQEAALKSCCSCPVSFLYFVTLLWSGLAELLALWWCFSFHGLLMPPLLPPCLFHRGFPQPFVLPSSPQPSHSIPQIYMAFRLRGEIDQPGLMHLEELINGTAAHSPPLLWNNFSVQIKHPICHKSGKAKRAPLVY